MFAVLLVAPALVAAPAPKLATAVFTLDAEQRLLVDAQDKPLADQLARWASECSIEPRGAIAVLTCRPAEPHEDEADPAATIPATLALFRDLDETIYLAGCPWVEPDTTATIASQPDKAKETVKPEDIRDCRDIAAGQTFSAEAEDGRLRIVLRGRQLALRIFETQEKPQSIDTPYVPTPARRMPRIGPQTTGERKGLEPQNEPRWEPPQPVAPSAGKPSQPRVSNVDPAHTSLRTGRVTIQCPSREYVVVLDDVYMGTCPVTTTLLAGPHTLTIRKPGKAEEVREFRIEAGETQRMRIED
jgi:hypothetical protein